MTGFAAAAAMEFEELEAVLLRMLPTSPPAETGGVAEVARDAGRWEVWQQVAAVLGVRLPYVVTGYEASVLRLRMLLGEPAPHRARP